MGPKQVFVRHCKLISCNKKFETKSKKKRFCSTNCRVKFWNKRHPRVSTYGNLKREDYPEIKSHGPIKA